MKISAVFGIVFTFLVPHMVLGQQLPDTLYKPQISNPMYAVGSGPVVFIDEGHYNFHTKDGNYTAFSKLLERDGYQVNAFKGDFETKKLAKGKILVIANALHKSNLQNWSLPTPSAFTKTEMETVKKWVYEGGNLFLIADHMPMAGAAEDLAAEFGFEFTNGFVFDTISRGPIHFYADKKTLVENTITKGRNSSEKVDHIATFTGQGFKIPDDASPILIFDGKCINMLPESAWVFNEKTERYNVKGWSQGAYKNYGKGRVVVFGEAAMFTAQLAGPQKRKFGMSLDIASENYQLLLNIIHWLDGKL